MSDTPVGDSSSVPVVARVSVTPAAQALIERLRAVHGPLMFHQSGGCCDGSAPMCFALGEFITGDADVCLGEIAGTPFYMSRSQFEYWEHTHLIIDAVKGNGGGIVPRAPTLTAAPFFTRF